MKWPRKTLTNSHLKGCTAEATCWHNSIMSPLGQPSRGGRQLSTDSTKLSNTPCPSAAPSFDCRSSRGPVIPT